MDQNRTEMLSHIPPDVLQNLLSYMDIHDRVMLYEASKWFREMYDAQSLNTHIANWATYRMRPYADTPNCIRGMTDRFYKHTIRIVLRWLFTQLWQGRKPRRNAVEKMVNHSFWEYKHAALSNHGVGVLPYILPTSHVPRKNVTHTSPMPHWMLAARHQPLFSTTVRFAQALQPMVIRRIQDTLRPVCVFHTHDLYRQRPTGRMRWAKNTVYLVLWDPLTPEFERLKWTHNSTREWFSGWLTNRGLRWHDCCHHDPEHWVRFGHNMHEDEVRDMNSWVRGLGWKEQARDEFERHDMGNVREWPGKDEREKATQR